MSEEALASSEPRTASQQQFATHTGAICTALQVHCTVRKGPMLSRHTWLSPSPSPMPSHTRFAAQQNRAALESNAYNPPESERSRKTNHMHKQRIGAYIAKARAKGPGRPTRAAIPLDPAPGPFH